MFENKDFSETFKQIKDKEEPKYIIHDGPTAEPVNDGKRPGTKEDATMVHGRKVNEKAPGKTFSVTPGTYQTKASEKEKELKKAREERDELIQENKDSRKEKAAAHKAGVRELANDRKENSEVYSLGKGSPKVRAALSFMRSNTIRDDGTINELRLPKEWSKYADGGNVVHLTEEMVKNGDIAPANFDAYNNWMKAHGLKPMSKRELYKFQKEHGFENMSRQEVKDFIKEHGEEGLAKHKQGRHDEWLSGLSDEDKSAYNKMTKDYDAWSNGIKVPVSDKKYDGITFKKGVQEAIKGVAKAQALKDYSGDNSGFDSMNPDWNFIKDIVDEVVHNGVDENANDAADTQNRQLFKRLYDDAYDAALEDLEYNKNLSEAKENVKEARKASTEANAEARWAYDQYFRELMAQTPDFKNAKVSNVTKGNENWTVITFNGKAAMGRVTTDDKGRKIMEFYPATKDGTTGEYSPNTAQDRIGIFELGHIKDRTHKKDYDWNKDGEDASDYEDYEYDRTAKDAIRAMAGKLESIAGNINPTYRERGAKVHDEKIKLYQEQILKKADNLDAYLKETGKSTDDKTTLLVLSYLEKIGIYANLDRQLTTEKPADDDNLMILLQQEKANVGHINNKPRKEGLTILKADNPNTKTNITKGKRTVGKYNKDTYGAGSVDWSDKEKTQEAEAAQRASYERKGEEEWNDSLNNIKNVLMRH